MVALRGRRRNRTDALPWEVAAVGGLALALRLVDLGHPPFVDELYHVLAGGSLLEEGNPTIHDGEPYTRALLFTYLAAGFMALFGDSLVAARLPAVLAGTALVCLLFVWLRGEGGRTAAWTGALLLALAPVSVYLSQWVRFYTLHALLLWAGIFGVYWLLTRETDGRRAAAVAGGSLLAFGVAFHLQVTTAVAVGALALFAGVVAGPALYGRIAARVGPAAVGVGASLLVIGVAGAAWAAGVHEWALDRLRTVDAWALEHADNPRFYHWLLTGQYGFLWTLLPVAALAGFAHRWRPALLLALVLGVALAVHSVAAWKAERYIFYALPALFGLWGLAMTRFLPWLRRTVERRFRLLLRDTGPTWLPGTGAVAVLTVAVLLAVTGIPALTQTRQIYLMGPGDWEPPEDHLGETYRGHADWAAVADELQERKAEADVFVAHADLKAVRYVGDLDFILDAGYLAGFRGGDEEFSTWPQVGRPVVSTRLSMERLRACYERGVVVAEEHVWGWSGGVPAATAEWIEEHASPVELPEGSGLLVYAWESAAREAPEDPGCRRLREIRARAPLDVQP